MEAVSRGAHETEQVEVPIRGFIDRYFNLLCLAFFALLVLGFVVIKVLA